MDALQLSALPLFRNYKINSQTLGKASFRVSTGLKINSAADDSASLGVSERMRSIIRGLDVSEKNVQDGISLIQVADGALTEIHNMLNRMTELSVASCNGINTSEDRQKLDAEYQQLIKEIDTISTKTEFNKMKILQGQTSGSISNVTSAGSVTGNGGAATVSAIKSVTVSTLDGLVLLDTDVPFSEGSYTFKVNGEKLELYFNGVVDPSYQWQFGTDINVNSGTVDLEFYNDATLGFKLIVQLENNISDNDQLKKSFDGLSVDIVKKLNHKNVKDSAFVFATTGITDGAQSKWNGFNQYICTEVLQKLWNLDTAANLSAYEPRVAYNGTKGCYEVLSNGVVLAESQTMAQITGAATINFNNDFGTIKVHTGAGFNPADPNEVTRLRNDLSNWRIEFSNLNTMIGENVKLPSVNTTGTTTGNTASTVNNRLGLYIQSSPYAMNGHYIYIDKVDSKTLKLNGTKILTEQQSGSANTSLKKAIEYVSNVRAEIGTKQNQLEHRLNSNNINFENLSASESRIRDADIAKEVINSVKASIKQQSITILLSQVSKKAGDVLDLFV